MCANQNSDSKRDSSLRLTERDVRLLNDIFAHKLMSSLQILRLGYFSTSNRANRRLAKLVAARLMHREPAVHYVSGQHSVFRVGTKAEPLLDDGNAITKRELCKLLRQGPSKSLHEHTLRIVDVRCAFVCSAQLTMEAWLPESLCRHEYSERRDKSWAYHILKPDAFIRVSCQSRSADAFIEVDLGNVSKSKLIAKLESYERYMDCVFQDTYGSDSFTLLFITNNVRRLDYLLGLTRKSDCRCLGTTFGQLAAVGVDAPIWRRHDRRIQELFPVTAKGGQR